MAFRLSSSAFLRREPIAKYTCDEADISPPLAWDDAPKGTRSFGLIMDDPDAPDGTWDHCLVYDLPPD